MYNNEVTYHEKWDTLENNAALKKLDKKFFDRSICSPDCPAAWAPEVLELLERLDKEFGIARNTSTLRAYRIQGNPLEWFIKMPFENFISSVSREFLKEPSEYRKTKGLLSFKEKLKVVKDATLHGVRYGIKAMKVRYLNPVLNNIFKPKIVLSQVKEKYGSLTMYLDIEGNNEQYVYDLVRETEIKLALKGCYYPVESFWDSASSRYINPDEDDIVTVEHKTGSKGDKYITVTETKYRKIMKRLGLNLKEIKDKADMRSASKADPV